MAMYRFFARASPMDTKESAFAEIARKILDEAVVYIISADRVCFTSAEIRHSA